jgi:dTMP kinase
MASGRFITFEGGDGAGKSTQAELLCRRLSRLQIEVDLTREPGGTPLAEVIRSVLLDANLSQRSALSELVLFYAARTDHLDSRIRPALDAGKWVICDRFIDSTRAYQGALQANLSVAIGLLEQLLVAPTFPDLTIILDVDPEIGIRRAIQRAYGPASGQSRLYEPSQLAFSFVPDRFEALDVDFHKRVQSRFLDIAKTEPSRCVVVDSAGSIKEVAERVWSAVSDRFALQTRD